MKHHLALKYSVAAVALTLISPHAVRAQQTTTPSAVVYVTGSNLKRTAREGTQPVQVLTAKDIRDTGATTVSELMRTVPSMGTDQNFDTTDGGFSRGVSTASLRGLSSTSTLILLNGRRMTPSAYADPNDGNSTLYDLNAIPLSALERVEILKDGASAVYGSDAIGGVINFITRSNYRGGEIGARASANDDGNFARRGASLFIGRGELDTDRFNVFLSADVSRRNRVARRDVTDIEFEQYRDLNGRFATPYGSFVSASPSFYRERLPGTRDFAVNRASMGERLRVTTNCDPAQRLTGTTAMGLPASSVFVGRTFCNYDTNQFLEGISDGEDANIMSRAVLKLGENLRLFAEAAYARSERDYTGAPITLGQAQTTNFTSTSIGTPFQAILEIGHPDNPFPDARASVGYRFENLRGGANNLNENTRLLTGLQGSLANWDWETALLYNRADRIDTQYGRLYLPVLRTLNTGTSLAALAAHSNLARDVRNDNQASILHWDARANTTFGQLGGGAMGLALGGEVRREKIRMTPDPLLATGQIFGLANTIIDGRRDVKSAFIEFRTPFAKTFELDVAGRADKYPGIKTNFVPKVGAKWTPMDTIAVRGTFGKGFRAPALSQVTPGGAQFFLTGLYDPKRCETDEETPKPGATEVDCNKSAAGTGGANPDLVPEKSKSASLGVLISPNANLDIAIDLYRIRKEGEVKLGSAFEALKNEDTNPGLVVRDPNPDNFVRDAAGNPVPGTGPLLMVREPWINQGAVEVRGVDFDIAYRRNLGAMGQLSTKLTSAYMDSYTLAQQPGDVEHNLVGSNAGIIDWNLSSGIALPRWKSTLTASLTRGVHVFSANMNYVSPVSLLRRYNGDVEYNQPFCHYGTRPEEGTGFTDAERNRNTTIPRYEEAFPECKIKGWTRVGVGYTFTGLKNWTFNLNIQNLFDRPAPYDPAVGVSTAGAPLAGYNAGLHNNYGRYYSLNAKYSF